MHPYVYCNIVYISQDMEKTYVPLNLWIDKHICVCVYIYIYLNTAAAKSLQSCPILRNPIDDSPPDSAVPEILQAKTLEWVAISFSNAWKWKVKVKSLSGVRLFATPWTAAHQVPPSIGFSRQECWSGVPLPSLLSHNKRWNFATCYNIDGLWGYYAKWNKSDGERQMPYDFTHMWNIENKRNIIY